MKLRVAIVLTLTSLTGLMPPGWAQSTLSATSPPAAIQFIPPPPPDRSAPIGRLRGGASRGQCPTVNQSLTALVPEIVPNSASTQPPEIAWGLTVSTHPTFWFYVPYALNSEVPLEFVLLDEHHNTVYQTLLTSVVAAPGIVSVTLPETAAPLEIGKLYQWNFLVYCGGEIPMVAQGLIERTLPPASQINKLSLREQADIYATHGIWFDALTALATLHRNNPDDRAIATDWASLLFSADLNTLAQQPFVRCCTPESE